MSARASTTVSTAVASDTITDRVNTSDSVEIGHRTAGAIAPTVPDGDGVRIERLILHSLDCARGVPRLVDELATLDEPAAALFAEYIAAAARRAEWQATFAAEGRAVVALCQGLLGAPEDFVRASRALARRLLAQMRQRARQIAPGDFVAAVYHAGGQRRVALLKLDLDQRLVRDYTRSHGRTRVRISAAGNLLPAPGALQKGALLAPPAAGGPLLGSAVALLDNQAGPRSEGVATFFYRGFLGCELAPSARRRTRLFVLRSEEWLSAHRQDLAPRAILGYYRARRMALAGESVRLDAFAAAALPEHPALREALVAKLAGPLGDGVDAVPGGGFAVDRATAAPYVAQISLRLDADARLVVRAEAFERLVRVAERRVDGKVQLLIETLVLAERS